GNGRWVVEVLSGAAPTRLYLDNWAARAGVAEAAITFLCEPVADRDWVAASLAGLKPVEAGGVLGGGRHGPRVRARRSGASRRRSGCRVWQRPSWHHPRLSHRA